MSSTGGVAHFKQMRGGVLGLGAALTR